MPVTSERARLGGFFDSCSPTVSTPAFQPVDYLTPIFSILLVDEADGIMVHVLTGSDANHYVLHRPLCSRAVCATRLLCKLSLRIRGGM